MQFANEKLLTLHKKTAAGLGSPGSHGVWVTRASLTTLLPQVWSPEPREGVSSIIRITPEREALGGAPLGPGAPTRRLPWKHPAS